jgi:hypothetical protein
MTSRYFILLAALFPLLVGCEPPPPTPDYWTDDGVGVVLDPNGPAWMYEAGFDDRLHTLLLASAENAARHMPDLPWNQGAREQPMTALRGWVIKFTVADSVPCTVPGAEGCMHHTGWIDLAVGAPPYSKLSLEYLPLPHEVLHVFIDDYCHEGSAWRDWGQLADEVNSWGYTAELEDGTLVPVHLDPEVVNYEDPTC